LQYDPAVTGVCEMITNLSSLNAYSYNSFFSGTSVSGKLYVPVKPAAVMYAQFDHVSGIAASGSQTGVSISKIQILNTLIDHLARIRNTPHTADTSAISPEYADALIKNYQAQIRSAVENTGTAQFILAGAHPQSGALFSISA
jgi:hypothetical protein